MARLDSFVLGNSVTFQSRVQASLLSAAVNIAAEGNVVNHTPRLQLVHSILASPGAITNYDSMFSLAVATDPTVLSDATQAGTVVLSSSNICTQQALVTDAHIDNAVSGQFNAFCQGILV